MKYFAKYLPVEGEIQKGDKYLREGVGEVYTSGTIDHTHDKKVKLFLCSRDIQVDDEIRAEVNGGEYHKVIDIIGNSIDCESLNGMNNETFLREDCAKIIGEISPEATWVKEGDEFEEEDIRIVYRKKFECSCKKDFGYERENCNSLVDDHRGGDFCIRQIEVIWNIEIKCKCCNTFK